MWWMEEVEEWWKRMITGGEENKMKRAYGMSLENSRPIHIKQLIFCKQLHLCPSHYHDLPSKSLNFLFNQFDPYFYNIPFHSLIYKFRFLFILWIYRFTFQAVKILLSYNRLKIYRSYKYKYKYILNWINLYLLPTC